MRAQKIWFVTCAPLIFALVALFGWADLGSGQTEVVDDSYDRDVEAVQSDAYGLVQDVNVGNVTVSPTSACYGQTAILSGTGHRPSVQLSAYMRGTASDGLVYYAFIGSPSTDASGAWTLAFAVPSQVIRETDGERVTTMVASWPVGASVQQDAYRYNSNTNNGQITYLRVTGPCVEGTTTTTLPNTGLPLMPALLGIPVLLSGGVAAGLYRRRRRP
jgi:LPXTG-motif cell wall-anchored protein